MNRENIMQYFEKLDIIMNDNREFLIELDSVVGDGDLGLTMGDGFKEANRFVKESDISDLGKLIYGAGKAMSTKVPSTMGTLMASGLMQIGKTFKGKEEFTDQGWIDFFASYFAGVAGRGKAKLGEKTFLDGLNPAVVVLRENLVEGCDLKAVAKMSAEAAMAGYENTATMMAVHGRAATRGEASITLKDPGAFVAALMMEAFYQTVK